MEHGLELIIARLEILEIGVCNIIHNPGNIGNFGFSIFLDAWKYWKSDFSVFWDAWKYYPNPEPNPKSLFLIYIYPCSGPDRPEATGVTTLPPGTLNSAADVVQNAM